MSFKKLSRAFSASSQITEADVEEAARQGFRAIISARPDNE
ncbi:MAG: sulfur transferase domain-containing protein, partial [Methylocystis sp.]|nr:sulfur transferase domain-containing protein [Methylocystis sp.]